MLRLSVFGGLRLSLDGAPVSAGGLQPRRLALLALLAVARDSGLSRDKIVGYLWPEFSDDRARHTLRQAVYALRSTLGASSVIDGTASLILNSEVIASDIAEFECAVAASNWQAAAASYAGPFLDGFFLRDAHAFEEWQDAERQRLEHLATTALEHLSDVATAGNDLEQALNLSRKLAALDPLNSRWALRLVRGMAAIGDTAGAVRHAQQHQALRREELGAGSDIDLEALTKRLLANGPTRAPNETGQQSLMSEDVTHGALSERWRIEQVIEHRATSSVFVAQKVGGNSSCSLRVFSPLITRMVEVSSLLAGLRRLVRLAHPRLLRVLEVGDIGGWVYCAVANPQGESLRQRLERQRVLAVEDVVQLATALARALDYAHGEGVLHLDIRPKHIFGRGAETVFGEMGIASALRAALSAHGQRTGLTIGAPAYMSPEQAAGQPDIDERSDLYSLGCVLYQALVGEPPFGAATPQALMMRRLTEAVPPLRHRTANAPAWLESIVMRLLQAQPDNRFASAGELLSALEDGAGATNSRLVHLPGASGE